MNYFTFDGIDSRTYNTYIATSNAFDAPGREDEVIKVPGSNNIYYLTEGTYKPFDIKLYCYIPSNMQVKTDDLRNFLLSKGTCTYTEAIRPNEFRVARFIEAYELDVSDRVSAAFVLTFKAQPQRYLISNDPITTTATADTTTDTTMSLSTVPTPISISLNGNTTQEGSSGKNLIPRPYYYADGTYQGVTWTTDNMGKITGSGTTTAGTNFRLTDNSNFTLRAGTYTLSITGTLTGINLKVYNGSAIIREIVRGTTNGHTTFTLSSAVGIRIYFNTGNTGDNVNVSAYVQLEKGSTATAYEPHISPTNPQVIHNVSGDNLITVSGNNLFDKNTTEILNAYINVNNKNIVSGGVERTFIMQIQAGNYVIKKPYYSANQRIAVLYFAEKPTIGSVGTLLINEQNNYVAFNMEQNGWIACWWFNGTAADGNYTNALNGLYISESQFYPISLPVENYLNAEELVTENNVFKKNSENNFTLKKVSTSSRLTSWATCNIENGKTYTFHMKAENGFSSGVKIRSGINGSQIQDIGTLVYSSKVYSITFVASANAQQLQIYFVNNATGVGESATVTDLQLEEGTKTNSYTPYGTPPIELNKIGTYSDYIYKNGGKWYLYKEFSKVDLGTLTWSYYSTSPTFMYNATLPVVSGTSSALCDAYPCGLSTDNKTFRFNGQILRIYDSDYSDASAFKTAMNGVMLYYPLATPTNIEITDTTLINQLNNLEKAYSYNGTTNILQVSNDNGFMLEVVSLHGNDVSSDYKGEPIITVNSTGLIYFNGCVIKVNQAPMTINSQTMQAYNGTVNLNNYIEADDFPMIEAGNNVIGSEMPLSIVPNYWKL